MRLKGSNSVFFSKDVTLLERRVKDCKICVSSHVMEKALAESTESIVTVKQLKRFICIINYLAIGLSRRSELMFDLKVAASGKKKLSERVEWTPGLKVAFEKLTKSIKINL